MNENGLNKTIPVEVVTLKSVHAKGSTIAKGATSSLGLDAAGSKD